MATLMRVRATGTGWSGAPGLLTFYFSGSAAPTAAEALEASARVRAVLSSAASMIPTGVSWQVSGDVDLIDDQTGSLVGGLSNTAPAVVAGSGTGSTAPVSTAILGRFTTASIVNGRRLLGRRYLSPVVVSQFAAAGQVAASAIAQATTAFGLVVVQITTPITHRVWHRPGPLGPGSSAASTSVVVPAKPAVLRSRRD